MISLGKRSKTFVGDSMRVRYWGHVVLLWSRQAVCCYWLEHKTHGFIRPLFCLERSGEQQR